MGRPFVSRAAWIAAIVVAFAAAAIVLLGGGDGYRVALRFDAASQLVKGNEVRTGGVRIGSVETIRLTSSGQAEVRVRIDDARRIPLRRGTQAIIRQQSLAGVANRYIDLRLPADDRPAIPDGGVIPAADTLAAVDLDQLFNTFDPATRRALSGVVRGSARQWKGQGAAARAGLLYLNPALSASNRLLDELDRDTYALERFLTASARFGSDVASESDALAPLVKDLATTTSVLRNRRAELGDTIDELPATLRRANTTFTNVRGALDDLEPLVRDVRPAARSLRPLAVELRQLATGARPALRDLSAITRTRGRDNDAIDLMGHLGPVRDVAVRSAERNGARRPGALEVTAPALKGAVEPVAFLRPYGADLTGWFDDFAHSGVYDALGGTGRIAFHTSAFTTVSGALTYIPPELREAAFGSVAQLGQRNRCPGSAERGTAYKPTPDFACDLTQVPRGR
jgi:phospholipid/cholesterol/gamma-HCH transport system substrate-binding protein